MTLFPIYFPSTFPLDHHQIQQRKQRLIGRTPHLAVKQWLAHWAQIGLQWTLPHNRPLQRFLAHWSEIEKELTLRISVDLVQESNVQQDQTIRSMVQSLNDAGHTQYAKCLREIGGLKCEIENQLKRQGCISKKAEETELLVDSICHAICDEIYDLTESHQQLAAAVTSHGPEQLTDFLTEFSQRLARIQQAHNTLQQTARTLRPEQQTPQPNSGADARELDRLLTILKEENRIYQRVHRRIHDELPNVPVEL